MLSFNENGLLPEGIHEVDLAGFEEFFGFNYKRRDMIDKGLIPFIRELKPFNVQKIYIDGSFVTQKENPGDIDGYVVTDSASPLFEFVVNNTERWENEYRVEFYAALSDFSGQGSEVDWQQFFYNTSSDSSQKKGFIALNISERR